MCTEQVFRLPMQGKLAPEMKFLWLEIDETQASLEKDKEKFKLLVKFEWGVQWCRHSINCHLNLTITTVTICQWTKSSLTFNKLILQRCVKNENIFMPRVGIMKMFAFLRRKSALLCVPIHTLSALFVRLCLCLQWRRLNRIKLSSLQQQQQKKSKSKHIFREMQTCARDHSSQPLVCKFRK